VTARPASTPTPGPSPTLTDTPTPAILGVLFGPFHLPASEFENPFYGGGFLDLSLRTGLSDLAAARAAGKGFIVHFTGGRSNFIDAAGHFDLEKWEAQLDGWRPYSEDIAGYIADGTIAGHLLLDEPQDKTNWGGAEMNCANIEAAAAYSESIWPGMITGIGSHAAWMDSTPCVWVSTDFALSPFVYSGFLTPDGYLATEGPAAERAGLLLYASLNVLDGGSAKGAEMTAFQVQAAGGLFLSAPNVCGLTLWKWDATYFARADIAPAVAMLSAVAAERTPCPKG